MINFIKEKPTLIYLICALLGAISINSIFKLEDGNLAYSNSIISLIMFFGFYFIISYAGKVINIRAFITACSLGFIFCCMLVLGSAVYINGTIASKSIVVLFLSVLGLMCIIVPVLVILMVSISKLNSQLHNGEELTKSLFVNDKKFFIIVWALFFLSYFIIFLAFYPGIYSYDAPWQLRQVFQGEFSTNHPVLHTFFLYFLVQLGHLLNSYSFGLTLYSIVQILLVTAIYAYACLFLKRINVPNLLLLFTIAFFAFMPINQLFSFIPTKDTLFAACSLLFIIVLLDGLLNQEKIRESKTFIVKLILFASLVIFLRNNAIYAYLFALPFILVAFKTIRMRMLIAGIVPVILYILTMNVLVDTFEFTKGRASEAFSVPSQQLARVFNLNEHALMKSEKDTILEIIPEEHIRNYNQFLSDPIKFYIDEDRLFGNKTKYMKIWIQLGLKYPIDYIDSFLLNSLGFWYPDMNFPQEHYYIETHVKDAVIPIERSSLFPRLMNVYTNIGHQATHQKIPVISMLFSPGIFTWILLFTLSFMIYLRKYSLIVPFVFLFGLWGTLLLSPIVLLRYSYPLFVCIPILLAVCLYRTQNLK